MPQFFLNKRLIILLISIILLVALIGYSLRERGHLSKPEQFLKDVVGFGQTIIAVPANSVKDFFGSISDIQNTYTENKKLKSRLDQLSQLSSEVSILKDDNDKLRKILGKKDDLSAYTTTQATVIARNPDQWYEHIIINKGKTSGIKENMAVITSEGFIGKVKSVSALYSTVELLSAVNPKNRISAELLGDNDKAIYGTIEGYDQTERVLLLKGIPYDLKIKKGTSVYTSGLADIFPKGLPIGTVEKLVPDENGLTQTAYVKPAADFYDIEHVMVVKSSVDKAGLTDLNGGGQ
ncbi:rod shape-determining protein MreC [Heyndrickxia shackletonii]|uniref:Cell shape-determining protein MreC n=1 Tax=Heyndrickxia shackletonii TaxID=157838 RepID=A0A0Q3WVX0_9BACI|nr:rod shape-determining protein MreC [Heyndrickxia shackletonii]KQL53402.1 rod shape-determining protein MreC [Heyndrickxia shackletonii]NEY99972.1 rod shape-determining protein MreC [Heyndrickxia shackletonii]